MINVSISEFVTLVVVPFWLRCFQPCVWVLNEKCGIKEKKLAQRSLNMLQEMCVLSPSGVERAPIAQLVGRRVVMREVVSSTPAGPTLRVLK